MDYLGLVTQKTVGLQQLMSSSASTIKIEEAEKLLDASNFRSWFGLLQLNAGLLDGLLYEYVLHGKDAIVTAFPGISEAAKRDPGLSKSVERLQTVLDRLIYSLIVRSVSSSLLGEIKSFGQINRSVLVMLQARYDQPDLRGMVNAMVEVTSPIPTEKAFTLCQSIIDKILRVKSSEEIGALFFLAIGCSPEIRDEIINIYSFGSGRSFDLFTLRQLISSRSAVHERHSRGYYANESQ